MILANKDLNLVLVTIVIEHRRHLAYNVLVLEEELSKGPLYI
jgi:hypothetical protein